jgi:hypothetical protein
MTWAPEKRSRGVDEAFFTGRYGRGGTIEPVFLGKNEALIRTSRPPLGKEEAQGVG